MAEPLILINTYRVVPGKEEEYFERFGEVVDIVEANEPKMLYFAEHVSEDGAWTSTVQVHADAENLGYHMKLVEDHIREAAEYIDWSSMSIQLFGSPGQAVLEQMRQLAGSGVSVSISPAKVSFDRFLVPAQGA